MIGSVQAGEWLEYSIDAIRAGAYVMAFDVAAGATGGEIEVVLDGVSRGFVSVPNSNWNLTTVALPLVENVAAGPHVLRLSFVGSFAFNFDALTYTWVP